MRKLLCMIGLIFGFSVLAVYSYATLPQEDIIAPISLRVSQIFEFTAFNETIKSSESNQRGIETKSETYTIKHEKDETAYTVVFSWNVVPLYIAYPELVNNPIYRGKNNVGFNQNYKIQLFNANNDLLQYIPLENDVVAGIYFDDVNFDDYTDIIVNTGGTLNETHDLYLWETTTRNFKKVIYEGFEMLSYFQVYEGYLMNWAKATAMTGVVQKLVWNGNTLALDVPP
ncbi:MAG: hypothetical protein LBH54_05285, partial [Clostridiales bacterium]|nr:hypothetical protein [Clostridiales bacterium]